ncbi:HIT-like protein (cell cycle regulation) [Mycoplasmopsis maculosa]|uniref:HIT-like protein (Cell cycle regulation) n=1 Tax=Mycoplasmopsis maculosa TaxID=114885 RepID=A0A449B502_9BACT|nr:HIT family protein [Mycoplasmopsis maculosa]VEU75608.1 HIT-like protein (cell cycle regulation) [Mycoplasmopsis maculosa]
MNDVFLKIINRELPAEIIYEDDICIAFFDKFPLQKGHFLVVPKTLSKNITEADDQTAAHLINVARKLAKERILDKGIPGFKTLINTGKAADQVIFHTHVHIIPYYEENQKDN